MRNVTMCLDCSKTPEYASTIKDAWCGPITEISDAYESILNVIREDATNSAVAVIDNSTIFNSWYNSNKI